MKDHIEDLKDELRHRDDLISKLQSDLKRSQQFQRGSASQVCENVICSLDHRKKKMKEKEYYKF